jgi:hypothetical protein
MAWIKRNLFFTIGSVIALLLLGAAGYYNFSSWSQNKAGMDKVQEAYNQLAQDYNSQPSPGNDQVDNIKTAQEQEQQLREWIKEAAAHFQAAPPIPNPSDGVVTTEEFAGSLRRTIQDLQQEAVNENVELPPDYGFTFAAERNLVTFTPGSLNPLASHLGEIKALCEIMFNAKINALDSIQREVVSDNDAAGPQSDYLADKTITTELATITPYTVTFRCFSSDLANVLSAMASSDYCFIVKGINVMPAGGAMAGGGQYAPGQVPPNYPPPPPPQAPPNYAEGSGGLATVLDEKLLQVTLAIEVVKLTK